MQQTKSASSKRGTHPTTKRAAAKRSSTGSSGRSRSNLREEDQYERSMGTRGEREGRGVGSQRDQGYRNNDYGREGVRTISGRYSDFEDYGGSSRNWQDRDESDRGFARSGRRGEYSSSRDQDFYEGSSGSSPWRETYDTDRNDSYRGSSRSQNYGGQGRGYSEFESDDNSRMNPRGSRYGSYRGYNEGSDYSDRDRESRYGSSRDRDERWMNNYDNQDESVEDEYGYRERYNENRY